MTRVREKLKNSMKPFVEHKLDIKDSVGNE